MRFAALLLAFTPAMCFPGAENQAAMRNAAGPAVYPRTAGETSASVTPSNFGFPVCNVLRYGADDSGAVDASTAFIDALKACNGATVIVPNGTYKLNRTLTLPPNTTLQGQNKRTTKLSSGANVDMLIMQDGSALYQIYLEGNGGSGRGIVINTGHGNQTVQNARIINFDPGSTKGVVDFTATDAGSRSTFSDCEVWNKNGATGSGKYAFKIFDALEAKAHPRKFTGIETAGFASFAFGGANDLFISNSFLADLLYSRNSRSVQIVASRIANQSTLTIDGGNQTLIADDVNPKITLAATLTNSVIGPISENHAPIIDNTGGNNSVQVFEYRQTYTPTMSNSGGDFDLGNGKISGYYSRIGSA
ncbi:MAG: glycosyl hydrolase family 28-related protein, partial [Steroidobacterales bacterium]